ncbi:DUF7344 domain-containing protein [Natronomonas amylolytica]|uniref:DUF7344 domain-containing protein n=1 Tax=Natronomonas amylolytica TaxID=3108498 RepID=UPI00300B843F
MSTIEDAVHPESDSTEKKTKPDTKKGPADVEQLAELAERTQQDAEDLGIGEVFELLKNERRRRVIAFLKRQDDRTTTLGVLAEHIASLENDIDVAQVSSSQRKRVYIALYQCHLPKMDDLGVIEYEKNRGTIQLRNTTLLDPYLADSDPETAEAEGSRTELAVAVAVAVVTAIGVTGIGVLSTVPAVFWTVPPVAALLWVASPRLRR